MTRRTPLFEAWPPGHAAMMQLEQTLKDAPVDPKLLELVKVRASQINGCAFCLDMHGRAAKALGESDDRLIALPAWRESTSFSPSERAALALTDALTGDPAAGLSDTVWDPVEADLGPAGTAALVLTVATINAWNRIAVATRMQPRPAGAAGRPAPDPRGALLRKHLDAENAHDLDAVLATLSPDCVFYDAALGQKWHAREGAADYYRLWWEAFGNVVSTESLTFLADGRAVAETTWHGLHVGPFDGLAATGRRVAVPVLIVVEFKDGLMAAETLHWDREALRHALARPEPPATGSDEPDRPGG